MSDATQLANALRRIAKVSYGATIEEAREVSKTQREAADLIEELSRAATQVHADAVLVPLDDLRAIYAAMNHLGDVLNGMDAVEPEDEVATNPGFDAIRRALGEAIE